MKALAKSPFKSDKILRKFVSNGSIKPRKPRPFRFPERKPKMTIKQVTRPNMHIHPHYVVPAPVVHYAHPYPYAYGYGYHYDPKATEGKTTIPIYPGYPGYVAP